MITLPAKYWWSQSTLMPTTSSPCAGWWCWILTVDSDEGGWRGPLSGHVGCHTAVVGRVRELGLQNQEAAGAADDEVGLGAGVDGDSVPQPGDHRGAGPTPGGMTAQFPLSPHLNVGVVGRSLEIFSEI